MGKINNIVFDFGGVLLDWDPRYLYRSYFESEEEMEYFLTHVCTDAWNREQDRGRSFVEGINILQAQYPQYAEAIQLFYDKWGYMLKGTIPKGVELINKFKKKGYNIYGLTNWSAETIGIAYAQYDFFQLFDGIVVSGEEKIVKPDHRIYQVLLERYHLKAEETIFLDNSPANISTAQQLGMKAILFDDITNVLSQIAVLINE